jgi:hypothetical protein
MQSCAPSYESHPRGPAQLFSISRLDVGRRQVQHGAELLNGVGPLAFSGQRPPNPWPAPSISGARGIKVLGATGFLLPMFSHRREILSKNPDPPDGPYLGAMRLPGHIGGIR